MSESVFVDTAACGDLDGIQGYLNDPDFPAAAINKIDKDGRSAFHYACLNDDVPLLTLLLDDIRVNVLLLSPNGDSALHMASLYAALEAMKLVFKDARIPISSQNKYGETPLHLCAGSGDKGAAKAARLLLENGASIMATDKWGRGPMDVSRDNAENPILGVFNDWLEAHPDQKDRCMEISASYRASNLDYQEDQNAAKLRAKNAIFGALGSGVGGLGGLSGLSAVKLKKRVTEEKGMFKKSEGLYKSEGMIAGLKDGRRALSKLIDFPGDIEEIKKHLSNPDAVDPAGCDSYGLTALHKFCSWNKTTYIELILPLLTKEELNAVCPEGKTALHWAVEMAAVGSVKLLVLAGANIDTLDGRGRSVLAILNAAESSLVIDKLKAALDTKVL